MNNEIFISSFPIYKNKTVFKKPSSSVCNNIKNHGLTIVAGGAQYNVEKRRWEGTPRLVSGLSGGAPSFSPQARGRLCALRRCSSPSGGDPSTPSFAKFLKSWVGVGLRQVLFLHLLRWPCDFSSLACWYDGLPNWFLNAKPVLDTWDSFLGSGL